MPLDTHDSDVGAADAPIIYDDAEGEAPQLLDARDLTGGGSSPGDGSASAAAKSGAPAARTEFHCLLIDDSRVIRGVSRRIMEGLGFKVAEAENGKEALERCAISMPDLIIVDWDMPIMTGIEFVTAVRAIPNGKNPKIIFCTSKNAVEDVTRGMSAGANEWIVKPFDQAKMLAKLIKAGVIRRKSDS